MDPEALPTKKKSLAFGQTRHVRVIRRHNGDRLILFKRNTRGHPTEMYFPDNWHSVEPVSHAEGRRVVRTRFGRRSFFVRDISPFRGEDELTGNTLFSEARILGFLHSKKIPFERVLAVYVSKAHLPLLISSPVAGDVPIFDHRSVPRFKENLKDAGVIQGDVGSHNLHIDSKGVIRGFDSEDYVLPPEIERKLKRQLIDSEYAPEENRPRLGKGAVDASEIPGMLKIIVPRIINPTGTGPAPGPSENPFLKPFIRKIPGKKKKAHWVVKPSFLDRFFSEK